MIGDNGTPETPEWAVTPHDPPEFLLDGLSAEEKFDIPWNIELGGRGD